MENKVKMTFGSGYEAPEVQIMEVLVEQGFQASLYSTFSVEPLDYSEDFNEFDK